LRGKHKQLVSKTVMLLLVCLLLSNFKSKSMSKRISVTGNLSDGSISTLSCLPTNVTTSVKFTIQREFKHSSRCPIPMNRLQHYSPLGLGIPQKKASTLFEFHLVYFVNCKIRNNYGEWMTGMLMGTRGSRLPPAATIYIVATSRNCKEESILHVNNISAFRKKDAKTILECHDEEKETYEYYGIHKAWQIGQELHSSSSEVNNDNIISNNNNNAIIGYFHSKGVTRAPNFHEYVVNHSHPTLNTMGRYEQVADAFALFPWVEKAGEFCGGCGWVWFNFWYARASYVSMLTEPVVTERRHYYEAWLGYKGSGGANGTAAAGVWNETEMEYVGNSMTGCYALGAPVNMGYSYDPFDGHFDPV